MKKTVAWIAGIAIVIIAVYYMYAAVPHLKQTAIADILNNPEKYNNAKVLIEGTPSLIANFTCFEGGHNVYGLSSGSYIIPINGDAGSYGILEQNMEVQVAGRIKNVCVSYSCNETTRNMECNKNMTGIDTMPDNA